MKPYTNFLHYLRENKNDRKFAIMMLLFGVLVILYSVWDVFYFEPFWTFYLTLFLAVVLGVSGIYYAWFKYKRTK